jgi:predicted SAM-dependent methyltransferase
MTINTRIKLIVKRILPAAGRRIWPIARRRIEQRLAGIEQRLAGIEQNLPAFLNAVSTVGAFGFALQQQNETVQQQNEALQQQNETVKSHASDIVQLWARLEFVRKEIMYEMKFGRTSSTTNQVQAEFRIVSVEKIAAARASGLRLNLGCGHVPREGYINVDQRDLPGVDIIADAGRLPFEEGSVVEIFSAHTLEHFPQERLRRLLPYWRSLLVPNGAFRAIVPDGQAMLDGIAAGTYPFEEFRMVLFGAQEYEGDFHFNLLTPDSLKSLLEEANFKSITVPVRGRKNDICFEFEINAKRN